MTRTSDNPRDRAIANDVGHDRALMCTAVGCPNRWTCDMGRGRLCSWHDRADPRLWPQITQEQLDAETERAQAAQWERPAAPPTRADVPRLRAELAKLADGIRVSQQQPRAWVSRLLRRERDGFVLTPASREMVRTAAGAHRVLDAAVAGAPVPEKRITAALVATGDIPSVHGRRSGEVWDECPQPLDIPSDAYDAAEAAS